MQKLLVKELAQPQCKGFWVCAQCPSAGGMVAVGSGQWGGGGRTHSQEQAVQVSAHGPGSREAVDPESALKLEIRMCSLCKCRLFGDRLGSDLGFALHWL